MIKILEGPSIKFKMKGKSFSELEDYSIKIIQLEVYSGKKKLCLKTLWNNININVMGLPEE